MRQTRQEREEKKKEAAAEAPLHLQLPIFRKSSQTTLGRKIETRESNAQAAHEDRRSEKAVAERSNEIQAHPLF